MKFLIALFIFVSGSIVFAQATSEAPAPTTAAAPTNTSTDLSFWEKIKKAPIGLFVDSDLAGTNSNGKYVGYQNVSNIYLSYQLSDKHSLRVNTGYAVLDDNSSNFTGEYQGTTLMYRRSGLLTEEKNGLNLRSELRYNFLPSNPTSSGSTSFRVAGSKSFGPKISIFSEFRWNEYIRKTGVDNNTRRTFVFLAVPSYNITDKLSFSGTTIFSQAIKGARHPNDIEFAPAINYAFTDKFYSSLYWDTYPFASNDGHFFVPSWASNGGLGLYLSYTIL